MKEDEYTKSLDKNQVRAIFHMRDFRKKRFTQIYKGLYGRRKATETSVFEFPNA